MRTFKDLREDRKVAVSAAEFEADSAGRKSALRYYPLLKLFLDLSLSNGDIERQARVSRQTLERLHEEFFAEFTEFRDLDERTERVVEANANALTQEILRLARAEGVSATPVACTKKRVPAALQRCIKVEGRELGVHVIRHKASRSARTKERANMEFKLEHLSGAGAIVVVDVEGYERDYYIFVATEAERQKFFGDNRTTRHLSFELRPSETIRKRQPEIDLGPYRDAWASLKTLKEPASAAA